MLRRFLKLALTNHWDKLLAAAGALCVLLPASPLNMHYTLRDSGLFLYIGWRILNGELPYRDVWDHKPPVIFYLNALGLAIAQGSRWGVWLLEFLSLFCAASLGFVLIRKTFGAAPASLSTVLWLATLTFVIEGGNMTTEYTLPLQFAALWLVDKAMRVSPPSRWHWLLLGLTGGIAFFTKQPSIGIWIAIVLVVMYYRLRQHQARTLISEMSFFAIGLLGVCVGWIGFFAAKGGLSEFWDAAFKYNFVYSAQTTSIFARFKPLVVGIKPLTATGLFQLAGIGYCLVLFWLLSKKDVTRSVSPLLPVALVNVPVELVLTSLSERAYPHYYMTLLPGLSLLAGVALWVILRSPEVSTLSPRWRLWAVVGMAAVVVWGFSASYLHTVRAWRGVNRDVSTVGMIRSMVGEGEKVLLWGAEAKFNFYAGRVCPGRFVYHYPLYMEGYTNEKVILEFLDAIISEKPKLIIDSRNAKTPIYAFPVQTNAIAERVRYLQDRYRGVGETEKGWVVYQYVAGEGGL